MAESGEVGQGARKRSRVIKDIVGLLLLLSVGVIWIWPWLQRGTPIKITSEEIIYISGDATEAEARALGEKFLAMKVFRGEGTGPRTAFLRKDARNGTVLTVVVDTKRWETDPLVERELEIQFREQSGERIAELVGGKPILMRFTDPELKVRKELRVE